VRKEGFFFFEKKKQKTFANAARFSFDREASVVPEMSKSFLLLFFKKEESFLLTLPQTFPSA
jgi:hypothetical protein